MSCMCVHNATHLTSQLSWHVTGGSSDTNLSMMQQLQAEHRWRFTQFMEEKHGNVGGCFSLDPVPFSLFFLVRRRFALFQVCDEMGCSPIEGFWTPVCVVCAVMGCSPIECFWTPVCVVFGVIGCSPIEGFWTPEEKIAELVDDGILKACDEVCGVRGEEIQGGGIRR